MQLTVSTADRKNFRKYGTFVSLTDQESCTGDGWTVWMTDAPLLPGEAYMSLCDACLQPVSDRDFFRMPTAPLSILCGKRPLIVAVSSADMPTAESVSAFHMKPGSYMTLKPCVWFAVASASNLQTTYYLVSTKASYEQSQISDGQEFEFCKGVAKQ